jgi:hypothetical protein
MTPRWVGCRWSSYMDQGMHVCISIYTCIYIYIYIHICVGMNVCISQETRRCGRRPDEWAADGVHTWIKVCVCVYVYIYIYIYIYTNIYHNRRGVQPTYMHTYMHTHTHTHTYLHIQGPQCSQHADAYRPSIHTYTHIHTGVTMLATCWCIQAIHTYIHTHTYRGHDARNTLMYTGRGEVVFVVGATGVVYNPVQHTQRFFNGHTDDIICMALHPNVTHVATGQVCMYVCMYVCICS